MACVPCNCNWILEVLHRLGGGGTASTDSPLKVFVAKNCVPLFIMLSCFMFSLNMFVRSSLWFWMMATVWKPSLNVFPDGLRNPEAGRPEGSAPPEDAGSRDGSPLVGSPVARASSRARDNQGSSGSDSDSSEDDSDDGVMHRIKSSVTHIKVSYNYTAFL